jgi:hypothetical protein
MSFMLSVAYKPFKLTVIMLTVIMLTVIMLTVIMLTVIMLTVIMLNVVASPFELIQLGLENVDNIGHRM